MFLTVGLKISHPGTKIPFIAQIQKKSPWSFETNSIEQLPKGLKSSIVAPFENYLSPYNISNFFCRVNYCCTLGKPQAFTNITNIYLFFQSTRFNIFGIERSLLNIHYQNDHFCLPEGPWFYIIETISSYLSEPVLPFVH